MEEKYDIVNRPQHYAGQGEVECIDFIEIMIKSYNGIIAGSLFNALKYTWRSHNKNGKQDLEKALYYANKAVEKINYYKNIYPCIECAAVNKSVLTVEENLLIFKAIKQITDLLGPTESKYFLNIVSCIINGGLINESKDYSSNLIDSIENWIKIYDDKNSN